ncbi:MAG TPA: DNA alkylation response protein, partial [Acidimicrobiales bacterium]|nr:DNA alkylation response protein [Acidimicrobiales bacterium]
MGTHEVFNQSVPLEGHDAAGLDVALLDGVAREGGGAHLDDLHRLGQLAGEPEWIHKGELANQFPPVFKPFDRFGHRVDEVEYHPAYHDLMTVAVREGLAGGPWADERPGAHVGRAAKFAV